MNFIGMAKPLAHLMFQHQGHSSMAGGSHALWEYGLAIFSVAIVIWVFYLAIRMTLRPGEKEPDHIKRTILEEDWKSVSSSQEPKP